MQQLTAGMTSVKGPQRLTRKLPLPPPPAPNPYAGMTEEHRKIRESWYRDVAVLAFPTPRDGMSRVPNADIKSLAVMLPNSSHTNAQACILSEREYPEPPASRVIDPAGMVDLTGHMAADGTLQWEVPAGEWTICRFVARSTGQTTRPAPRAGHGFECDKFNAAAYRRHWEHFQKRLIDRIGLRKNQGSGLTTIHLDSWEMGSQNWSAGFREAFRKRRGYDPQPFYPAYLGLIVGSREKTERFLWDLRTTAQELLIENYAGAIRETAHANGLLYSNEPYDMNPAGDLDLGAAADIPSCEFWNPKSGYDTQFSCIEAASLAHTLGKPLVSAEAFTSRPGVEYQEYPANLKNQTDWALAMGVNQLLFHTFAHQPLGEAYKPGMTMGAIGLNWHRNQAMWPFLSGYHQYIARCCHMMRQGVAVADILFLTPEGAPHVFLAPSSALQGPARLRDKRGYAFDAVSPKILKRATVQDGRIAFPQGTAYGVLVLPETPSMTPETLGTIAGLLEAGATVIGTPPLRSPSLTDYPACDEKVSAWATRLWGRRGEKIRRIGKGTLIRPPAHRISPGTLVFGPESKKTGADFLYPDYSFIAAALRDRKLAEDLHSAFPLRFGHRRTPAREIYFLSNPTDRPVTGECSFRVAEGAPEFWDPVNGEIRALPQGKREAGLTILPLSLDAYQSGFVVFPRNAAAQRKLPHVEGNMPELQTVCRLDAPWRVSFDPRWGGPTGPVIFDRLQDWRERSEKGIRYYSGVASYRQRFSWQEAIPKGTRLFLDLGQVQDLARVRLNGKELGIVWTAPWRIEITAAVHRGENELEIEIANRWVNRLIGDQQPGERNARTLSWSSGLLEGKAFLTGRYTFTTWSRLKAESPLLPAGLIGPVRILRPDLPR